MLIFVQFITIVVFITCAYSMITFVFKDMVVRSVVVGLGGLGVTSSPRDPRFAGSNPTEFDGFFQDVKILSKSPPGGTLSWGFRV